LLRRDRCRRDFARRRLGARRAAIRSSTLHIAFAWAHAVSTAASLSQSVRGVSVALSDAHVPFSFLRCRRSQDAGVHPWCNRRAERAAAACTARRLPTAWQLAEQSEAFMLYWAAVFLVIALVAGVLGLGGVAVISKEIAWILFIVGLVLAVIAFFMGRRAP
jgi:uncharacterized membrane protein YtjA (UPF0391 family)